VPRSLLLLSGDPNLFERVRAVLRPDDRFIIADDEVHCDGSIAPVTNIYPVEMGSTDWHGWDSGDSQIPEPRTMSALMFECSSPVWVAEVGRLLAEGSDGPVWFVDSADTAWPAGAVDPERVALA
jgi:hypothetical protein